MNRPEFNNGDIAEQRMRVQNDFGAYASERWLPMPGYEGSYEVSSLGRVRSSGTQALRTFLYDRDGYTRCDCRKEGKYRKVSVHRAVAMAFLGVPDDERTEVAHLDGNRKNARLDNLQWVTHRDNMLHQKQHGTQLVGSRHPCSLLNEHAVVQIRNAYAEGADGEQLAAAYGVSASAIYDITKGKTWKHVGGPLTRRKSMSREAVA